MRRYRRVVCLSAIVISSVGCASEPPAPERGAALAAEDLDAARLVERLQSALLERPRAFGLVARTGSEVRAAGELLIASADPETPRFLLTWEEAQGPRRVSSDGVAVYAETADGDLLTSRWDSVGTVLFSREAGQLVPAVLNASSFASYGAEVVESESGDVVELRAPLPTGGAWKLELGASGLPRRISLQADLEAQLEELELTPLDRPVPADPSGYRLQPGPEETTLEFFAGPAPGDAAPEVEFSLADGTRVALADLRGSVVVLDFWATWCLPCRPAMRQLEELHREHGDSGLKVYGLRLWDLGDPTAFLEDLGITYAIGDGAPFAAPYAIPDYGLPTLYVVDRQGTIFDLAVGFKPGITEDRVRDAILRALDG